MRYPHAVVLVQGRKILKVGPSATVKVPEKAEKIDARGKFLLPALVEKRQRRHRDQETFSRPIAGGIPFSHFLRFASGGRRKNG